jgi:hypothetical protein
MLAFIAYDAGLELTPVDQSFVNPLGLGFTLLMGVLLITLPRRYALVPVVMLTCFMSMGQVLVVMGLHFNMIRILTLFGWARLIVRREIHALRLNPIDKALLWWTLSSVVINTLLWHTAEAFSSRLGLAYNALGLYFLFRFLVRDFDDIIRVFRITAVLIIPLAAAMLQEWVTRINAFAIFGVRNPIAQIRDGALRCSGPFEVPILAGTFAAALLPFFVVLWQQGRANRILSGLAILSSGTIIFTTASSGPYLTALVAVAGLFLWPWRKYMRGLRWAVTLALISLHLIMKSPVWFVLARIDVVSGSTGFHRAYLIDRAVATFWQWCFLGIKSTEIFGEQIHGDITNQYIMEGINGGFVTMVLFIVIIVNCFRSIGRIVAREDIPLNVRRGVWAMGAVLFAHAITYLSISYFDQNFVNWYLLLALISTTTGMFLTKRPRRLAKEPQRYAPSEFGNAPGEAAPVHFLEV